VKKELSQLGDKKTSGRPKRGRQRVQQASFVLQSVDLTSFKP
jgi:hypothetical protein